MSKQINPHLYTFSLWGSVVFFIISLYIIGPASLIVSFWLLLAGEMYSVIYFLISLYRCWSILQGLTARTTPSKAVGFLFIPFYNFYWLFVAIRGLAKDANTFLSQKNINENKISEALSLATCILCLIPYIDALVTPILANILIYQWAKFFNYSITNLEVEYK